MSGIEGSHQMLLMQLNEKTIQVANKKQWIAYCTFIFVNTLIGNKLPGKEQKKRHGSFHYLEAIPTSEKSNVQRNLVVYVPVKKRWKTRYCYPAREE